MRTRGKVQKSQRQVLENWAGVKRRFSCRQKFKGQKAGFGMVFCITGGVLGIRCNLEGSSFEPPGSLCIYLSFVVCLFYHF